MQAFIIDKTGDLRPLRITCKYYEKFRITQHFGVSKVPIISFSYGSLLTMVGEVFILSPQSSAGEIEIVEVATRIVDVELRSSEVSCFVDVDDLGICRSIALMLSICDGSFFSFWVLANQVSLGFIVKYTLGFERVRDNRRFLGKILKQRGKTLKYWRR